MSNTVQYNIWDTDAVRLTAQHCPNTTSSRVEHTLHAPHIHVHSIEGSCLCNSRTMMYCPLLCHTMSTLSTLSHNVNTVQYNNWDTDAVKLTAQHCPNTTSSQVEHTLNVPHIHVHFIEGSCLCNRRTVATGINSLFNTDNNN